MGRRETATRAWFDRAHSLGCAVRQRRRTNDCLTPYPTLEVDPPGGGPVAIPIGLSP